MANTKIQFDITAKDRSRAALKQLQGNLDTTKSAVAGLTKLLAPLAAAFSVGVIGTNLVRTNREFQQLKASLQTFTGSIQNADRSFKILQDFAKSTPFALQEVVSSFNILIARGIDPTVGQLKTFGDIAAGSGKSFSQLAEAVADAAVNEFDRLKEFGIKASKENDKITLKFGDTTKTVNADAASILAALTEIGTTNFAGATERQAQTLEGAFSNLGDQVDSLFFSIGEEGLNAEINRLVRRFSDAIGSSKDFASVASNVLVRALRGVEAAFDFVAENISAISIGLTAIFSASLIRNIASVIVAIGRYAKAIVTAQVVVSTFSAVTSLFKKNLLLGAAALGSTALAVGVFSDEIGDAIKSVGEKIGVDEILTSALEALGLQTGDTEDAMEKLAESIDNNTVISGRAVRTTNQLTEAERDLKDQLQPVRVATEEFETKLKLLKSIKDKTKMSTQEYDAAVGSLALELAGIADPTAKAKQEQELLEAALKQVTAAGGDNEEALRLIKSRLIDVQAETEKTYGAGAIKGVKDYYESISNNAANASTAVGDAFNALESDLSEFFQTGKLDFDGFKSAIIKGLADIAAKAVISTGINFLGEVFPSLQFAEGGYVGGFASGGFVSGPGGPKEDRILARLSDGEYVMNANSVNKFGRGFFDKLNSGQVPGKTSIGAEVFGDLQGFGLGGFIGGIIGGIGDAISSVAGAVTNVISGAVDIVGDIAGDLLDSAKKLVGGILEGDLGTIAKFALPFILPGLGSGITAALGQFGAAGFSGVLSGVGTAMSNSLAAGVLGAGSTSAIATSVLTGLASDTFTSVLADKISSSLVSGFSGLTGSKNSFDDNRAAAFAKLVNGANPYLEKRAMGGDLGAGQAAMVGENGPEIFIPGRNGTVAPIKGNASDLIGAVNEVRDEISDLRRQFARALAGQALVGSR